MRQLRIGIAWARVMLGTNNIQELVAVFIYRTAADVMLDRQVEGERLRDNDF